MRLICFSAMWVPECELLVSKCDIRSQSGDWRLLQDIGNMFPFSAALLSISHWSHCQQDSDNNVSLCSNGMWLRGRVCVLRLGLCVCVSVVTISSVSAFCVLSLQASSFLRLLRFRACLFTHVLFLLRCVCVCVCVVFLVCVRLCVSPIKNNSLGHLTERLQTTSITW